MNAGDNYEMIVVIKFGYLREHPVKLRVLVYKGSKNLLNNPKQFRYRTIRRKDSKQKLYDK